MDQQRFIGLFVMIFTIAGTLLLLSLFEREASSKVTVECVDLDTRERVRKLSLDGYDQAFRDHTATLFKHWVNDPHDQPTRAQAGTQIGINAYIRARKFALEWNPPPCPPEK